MWCISWLALALMGCVGGEDIEGNDPRECVDGVDNDEDGQFDCFDSDCANSPDCNLGGTTGGQNGTGGPPVTSGTSPATTGPVGVPGCPWAGTWEVWGAYCDGLDVTADFDADFSTVSMVIESDCGVDISLRGDSCLEVESQIWTQTPGGATVTSSGITACQPNNCRFDDADLGCQQGDRTATPVTIPIENVGTQTIVTSGLLSTAWNGCPGGLRLRWQWTP